MNGLMPWACRQSMRVLQAIFGHKTMMWAMAVIVCEDDVAERVVGASMNVQLLPDGSEGGDDDDDDGLSEFRKIARDRWGQIDDASE